MHRLVVHLIQLNHGGTPPDNMTEKARLTSPGLFISPPYTHVLCQQAPDLLCQASGQRCTPSPHSTLDPLALHGLASKCWAGRTRLLKHSQEAHMTASTKSAS